MASLSDLSLRARVAGGLGALLVVGVVGFLRWGGDAQRLSVRAPQPGSSGGVTVPELPTSVFTVPVEVDLARLVTTVEGALPRRFGDLDDRMAIPGRDDLDVAFEIVRNDLSATFTDSIATLRTTLSYRARAWYDPPILPEVSASCGTDEGEPMPRLDVTLVTPLSLDEEWRLRSRIRPGPMAPPTDSDRDRCRVTVLNFDMTGRIVDAAHDAVEEYGPEADSALAALDLRDDFREWWTIIATPIRLADDVWLELGPLAVGRGPIVGTGDALHTALTLEARPRVVVAGEAPTMDTVPLPPLRTLDDDRGLRILAEAEADYGEVEALLREELAGRSLTAGGEELEVAEIELRGVGDGRLAIRLAVTGDANGELYLVGTPVYDPIADQIGVPDLEFDVATREALVAGAAWIARVGLVERVRDRARWPAAPAADWARRQVETGFNSTLANGVRLEGSVDEVSVLGVHADVDVLRVRAEVRGRATLRVEGAGG